MVGWGGTESKHIILTSLHRLVNTTGNWCLRCVWCSDNTNETMQPFHNTKYQTNQPGERKKKWITKTKASYKTLSVHTDTWIILSFSHKFGNVIGAKEFFPLYFINFCYYVCAYPQHSLHYVISSTNARLVAYDREWTDLSSLVFIFHSGLPNSHLRDFCHTLYIISLLNLNLYRKLDIFLEIKKKMKDGSEKSTSEITPERMR